MTLIVDFDIFVRQLINHPSYIGSDHNFGSVLYLLQHTSGSSRQFVIWRPVVNENSFYISFSKLSKGYGVCHNKFIFLENSCESDILMRNKTIYVSDIFGFCNQFMIVTSFSITRFYSPEFLVQKLTNVRRTQFNRFDHPCLIKCESELPFPLCAYNCQDNYRPWSLSKLSGFVINSYFGCTQNKLNIPPILIEYLSSLNTEKEFNNFSLHHGAECAAFVAAMD